MAIVTRSGLSEAFGRSLPTIDRWIAAGMPVVERGGKGKEWQIDTAAVFQWRENKIREEMTGDSVSEADEARRRKLSAEAMLTELELAKATGRVALIDEFEKAQTRVMAIIRANLLNVPARATLQLLGVTDETLFKSVLRAEISHAIDQAIAEDLDLEEDSLESE